MSAKVLFHVDMNAYFASVAINQNPSLKGKPLVVAKNRSDAVITTASYEARVYGIHSAMPLSIALTKCPQLEIVEPDFELYTSISKQFIDYLKTYSQILEVLSIDECFLDVTEKIKGYSRPLDLADEIQQGLLKRFNLSCSIGVAPNRFLAKMASNMRKPMGITVLRMREVKRKLWPLPIEQFHGIGKVTQEKLKAVGVLKIGDLLTIDKNKLIPILNNQTDSILLKAQGIDSAEINMDEEIKSISASNSLVRGVNDYQELTDILYEQCLDIVSKLNKHKLFGLTLTVGVAINRNKTTSKSIRKETGFNTLEAIYQSALLLLDQFEIMNQTVTYLTTGLSNLKEFEEDEIYNLFNYNQQTHSVNEIISKINNLFKNDVLMKASDKDE